VRYHKASLEYQDKEELGMRKGDDLFFAPGIRFGEVDLGGEKLPDQYLGRIRGFYLEPARLCINHGHAFAAGLLLVSTIDFMAGLHHSARELGNRTVGADFRQFVQKDLPSFQNADLAQRLYDEFRNGLTHEARIKNAGEFSFDRTQTVSVAGGRLCINPQHLLAEVETALQSQISELRQDRARRQEAAKRLRGLFAKEFGILDEAMRAG
jgi:hypothetical protein